MINIALLEVIVYWQLIILMIIMKTKTLFMNDPREQHKRCGMATQLKILFPDWVKFVKIKWRKNFNDDNYYGNSKATKWNKWVFASCFSILCLLCILLHPAWVHVTSSKPQSQALHPLVMWSDRSLSSPSHLQWLLQHLTCSRRIIQSLFLSTSN